MKRIITTYLILVSCITLTFGQQIGRASNDLPYDVDTLAYEYYIRGIYDSAEIYYLKAIDLYKADDGTYSERTASSYINLGAVYRKLYQFSKAIECLNIAEEIFTELEEFHYYLGYIYNNKGNIYYSYSDYAEAERYYQYSLELFEKINYTDDESIQKNTLNIFNILILQNKLAEAEAMIDDISKLNFVDRQKYEKHLHLAQAYERLGRYEHALDELKISRSIVDKLNFATQTRNVEINYRSASILLKLGEIKQAHSLLLDNITLLQNNKNTDFISLAQTYCLIGKIHFYSGNYKNTIQWLIEAETDLIEKLNNANIESTTSTRSLNSLFLDLKQLQAKTYESLYTQTNDIKNLHNADHIYSSIIEETKISRIHMRNEESKYHKSESNLHIINDAIRVALKLYQISNDHMYLERAFLYAENAKSFALLSEITDNQAIQFADLPSDILATESNLTNEIAAYEELIFSEKTVSEPDTFLLNHYNEKLFQLKDDYNDFSYEIENDFPKYFELKYNPHFVKLEEVQQKLHRKDALVEYVLTDSVLYTFVIDKENTHILERKISPDFPEDCFKYFTILQSQDFNQNVHETYKNYVQLGRMFYETLVAPVLEVTESREITFVPDGAIMYLPFETFVTEDVDLEYVDYHSLPYMIYEVSVGYSYSSTLLYKERIKTKSPERKVLAFAPAYENLQSEVDPLEWNRQANPDYLVPLKGAREEVLNISKSVPSVTFMDYDATEGNFKKYAQDYSILHLAMHTIMSDSDPMNSKLAFARNFQDTTQDHDLFTYEIYNMQLNADMVVLSSCSSGFGKIQRGEGMMSMARGFIYAGCPSIIMTLWQVSDRSSAELMSSFYKHLKHGKSKKSALRQAKIDYIESSDKIKSNPYFWSAFMVVGDSSPLYGNSPATYWLIIVSSFLTIIIFFYHRKNIYRWIKKN